jgi:uncharacterized membrane protein YkoI
MKSWMYGAPLALTLALAAPVAHADDITMAELPAPVRETVQREVGSAELGDIERDDDDGTTVYEIEFRENDRKFELDVSPDGRVLRRHAD